MEYKVLTAANTVVALAATQMEKEVNKLLVEGWTLYGEISTAKENGGRITLIQAMIKK